MSAGFGMKCYECIFKREELVQREFELVTGQERVVSQIRGNMKEAGQHLVAGASGAAELYQACKSLFKAFTWVAAGTAAFSATTLGFILPGFCGSVFGACSGVIRFTSNWFQSSRIKREINEQIQKRMVWSGIASTVSAFASYYFFTK